MASRCRRRGAGRGHRGGVGMLRRSRVPTRRHAGRGGVPHAGGRPHSGPGAQDRPAARRRPDAVGGGRRDTRAAAARRRDGAGRRRPATRGGGVDARAHLARRRSCARRHCACWRAPSRRSSNTTTACRSTRSSPPRTRCCTRDRSASAPLADTITAAALHLLSTGLLTPTDRGVGARDRDPAHRRLRRRRSRDPGRTRGVARAGRERRQVPGSCRTRTSTERCCTSSP